MTKPRYRVPARRPGDNVVRFPGEHRTETIDGCLRQFTGRSDVQSIAVAGVLEDGSIITAFVGGGRLIELTGALANVSHRVIMQFNED